MKEKRGSYAQPFGYTGYQYDNTSNLYFAQARYYDPALGRFVSEDRIKGNIIQPDTINPYIYCLSNPLRYVDLDGRNSTPFDKFFGDLDGIVNIDQEDSNDVDYIDENGQFIEPPELKNSQYIYDKFGENVTAKVVQDELDEYNRNYEKDSLIFATEVTVGCALLGLVAGSLPGTIIGAGIGLVFSFSMLEEKNKTNDEYNAIIQELKVQEQINSWHDDYLLALKLSDDDCRNVLIDIIKEMRKYDESVNYEQNQYIQEFYKFILQECGYNPNDFEALNLNLSSCLE